MPPGLCLYYPSSFLFLSDQRKSPPPPASLGLGRCHPICLVESRYHLQQGRQMTSSGCFACGICLVFIPRFCVLPEAPDSPNIPGKVCGFIPAQLASCMAVLMPGFPDGQAEILRTHCLRPFSAAVTFLFPCVTLTSCSRSFPCPLLLLFLGSLKHHSSNSLKLPVPWGVLPRDHYAAPRLSCLL